MLSLTDMHIPQVDDCSVPHWFGYLFIYFLEDLFISLNNLSKINGVKLENVKNLESIFPFCNYDLGYHIGHKKASVGNLDGM